MSKKITQLPSATSITGRETLPLVQSGRNVSAGVGVSQIPQVFGDLPTTSNIGTTIFVPDAVGGAWPAYWDGTQWRTFGGVKAPIKTMGAGIWIIGIEASFGLATGQGYDAGGFYFMSLDGFNWDVRTNPTIKGGIHNTSYANGCFLQIGISSFSLPSAIVATSTDPENPVGADKWNADPPLGYNIPVAFSDPEDPIAYDNPTGLFTVPITGVGNVQIQNQLPSAVEPDLSWPYNGQDVGSIVLGIGTAGPVEVGVFSTTIPLLSPAGNWNTDYIMWRRPGTADWQFVNNTGGTIGGVKVFEFLSASSLVAGLQLRGLIWGPLKQTAVQFAPGSN